MTILYRLLVRLAFPARVRRRFGADMVRMFERQLAEARTAGAPVLPLWMHARGRRLRRRARRTAGGGHGSPAHRRTRARSLEVVDARMGSRRRYAVRLLVRQPGVTVVALLTLAHRHRRQHGDLLGGRCGAAPAAALPGSRSAGEGVGEADRAKACSTTSSLRPTSSTGPSMNTVFEDMAAYMTITADLTGTGEPVRLSAAGVSPPFFDILRVQPALGRTFRREEATPGQHRVVVLGHELWQATVRQRPRRGRAQDRAERRAARNRRRAAAGLRVPGPGHRAVGADARSNGGPTPPHAFEPLRSRSSPA